MKSSYRFPVLFFLLIAGLGVGDLRAAMLEADAAYAERSDLTQAMAALELYQIEMQADPRDPHACWKGARAAWWVGDQTSERAQRLRFFNLGMDMAQEGLKRSTASAESYFWLGVNQGSFGETKGVLKSLFLVKPIREAMETVLALNPAYEGGAAWRVLGVVDYKVPGFAGGNAKRAEERLLKSLQLGPDNPLTLYYLAEYYVHRREHNRARAYLSQLKALAVAPELKPEWVMMMKKAETLELRLSDPATKQ